MGTLTDLVLADEGEAPKIVGAVRPTSLFPGIEMKGLDIVKLTALQAIVTGQTWTADLVSQHPLVGQGSQDGPWVLLLSQEFIAKLAELPGERLPELVARWAATDEVKADRWAEPMVRDTLQKIIQLAQQAITRGKRMFLWMIV